LRSGPPLGAVNTESIRLPFNVLLEVSSDGIS
jgi:hypothetical protein